MKQPIHTLIEDSEPVKAFMSAQEFSNNLMLYLTMKEQPTQANPYYVCEYLKFAGNKEDGGLVMKRQTLHVHIIN